MSSAVGPPGRLRRAFDGWVVLSLTAVAVM